MDDLLRWPAGTGCHTDTPKNHRSIPTDKHLEDHKRYIHYDEPRSRDAECNMLRDTSGVFSLRHLQMVVAATSRRWRVRVCVFLIYSLHLCNHGNAEQEVLSSMRLRLSWGEEPHWAGSALCALRSLCFWIQCVDLLSLLWAQQLFKRGQQQTILNIKCCIFPASLWHTVWMHITEMRTQ